MGEGGEGAAETTVPIPLSPLRSEDSSTPLDSSNCTSEMTLPPVEPTSSSSSVDPENPSPPVKTRTQNFDPENENHYVFVIHGTFDAPPKDGLPTWYQLPEPGEQNFCSKLGKLLDQGVVQGDAIWKDLPCEAPVGIPYPFHWDGSNTHEGRVDAATKLHRLIDFIADNDPAARIHLVAHSHGGNVLLKTVDLYMNLLMRKERRKEISPVMNDAFWKAYRRPYEMIRRWRSVHVDPTSPWKYCPFLILWRNADGHVASRGQCFPWGYYKWWDTLLGLGMVRQRMFLQQRIVTSPISNALGTLVFLGTPFYVKKWEDFGFVYLAINMLVLTAVAYVMMATYIFVWKIIIQSAEGFGIAQFAGQPYITFSLAAAICVFVVISLVMQTTRTTVFRSGNLYHHAKYGWSPAMSALVIHAGKLDEASLALSTEPVVRAYVFPQLTKLLKQTPWQPLPKRPSIYDKRREWFAFFFNYFMAFFWDVLFFFPALIISALSYIIAPVVTGIIQKIVVTISFGLAPGELNFAYVYVDEFLDLQELHVNQVDHWNVQKLLAQAKTKSLQGLLLEGYEDDTVEQPEWMDEFDLALSKGKTASGFPGVRSPTPKLEDAGRTTSVRRRTLKRAQIQSPLSSSPAPRGMPTVHESVPPQEENSVPVLSSLTSTSSFTSDLALSSDPGPAAQADQGPAGPQRLSRKLSRDDSDDMALPPPVQSTSPVRASSRPALTVREEKSAEHMVGGMLDHSINKPMTKLVYDFLWDDAVLNAAARGSMTYKLLSDQKDKIDHNPRLEPNEFDRQLKAMCLMIEERINELTGRVDLNHGAYFRDPRILRVIAYFITNRCLPEWSKEIDTDISRMNDHLEKISSSPSISSLKGGFPIQKSIG